MAGCRSTLHGRRTTIRRLIYSFLLGMFLSACADQDLSDGVFPDNQKLTDQCKSNVIANHYVVHYKSGRIERIQSDSIEKLKETYMPKIDHIRKIEHDIHFDLKTKLGTTPINSNISLANWGYQNTEAEVAWQSNYKGEGVIVAVIDSGVDTNHPLLQNQIHYNQGEAGAKANNGIDDDGNGYVDDYAGYDFLNGNASMLDEVGHGTHVAGVIAAEHNENNFTQNVLLSVAPKAKIMALKFIGSSGGSLGGALEAMEYAASNGAKIINASWGGRGCSTILQDKIIDLGQRGVLFVAAAGNSGNNLELSPEYPAAFPNTAQITVGSITNYNGMSEFSNYSSRLVHLFAPGSEILSTYKNGSTEYLSGTSMATPFVAGAAALVASAHPTWTPAQIKAALLQAVVTNSFYSNQTQGRLNVRKLAENL